MSYTLDLGIRAKNAEPAISGASTAVKNAALAAISKALTDNTDKIIAENAKDLAAAKENGMSESMQDRLKLDKARIEGMAKGVDQLIARTLPESRKRCYPQGRQGVYKLQYLPGKHYA